MQAGFDAPVPPPARDGVILKRVKEVMAELAAQYVKALESWQLQIEQIRHGVMLDNSTRDLDGTTRHKLRALGSNEDI